MRIEKQKDYHMTQSYQFSINFHNSSAFIIKNYMKNNNNKY